MGISLLGIVAVQVYWFNNSVNVRNELFDRSVNDAMNKAVRRLETGHDLKVIRNLSSDTTNWEKQIPFPPPPPPPPPTEYENMDVIVKRDTIHNTISVTTSKRGNSKAMSYVVMSGTHTGKNGKAFKVLTENHYGSLNDSDLKIQLSINDSVIGKKIKQLKTLSNQIQIEYKGWETGRHIDELQLKKLLREELTDRAIPIDFKMTVQGSDNITVSISVV